MTVVVIPAYKPTKALLDLVEELAGFSGDIKIVVVDDGSGKEKEYEDIFCSLPEDVVLLTHKVNRGKGRALKTGIAHVRENMPECNAIITADADGQHRCEDIMKLHGIIKENRDSLILGRRKFDQSVPWRSRFGNTITRHVFAAASGMHVYDTQTGLRAFSRSYFKKMLNVAGERYEYEINVLLMAAQSNIPIIETPIQTVYFDGNKHSHFDSFRDSIRIYLCLLKFASSSLFSFAVDFSALFFFRGLTSHLGDELSLFVSVVLARAISASCNFTINRKLVFKSREPLLMSMSRYALLVLAILLLNYFFLRFLNITAGVALFPAKFLVELILFIVSFFVQGRVVFHSARIKYEVISLDGKSKEEGESLPDEAEKSALEGEKESKEPDEAEKAAAPKAYEPKPRGYRGVVVAIVDIVCIGAALCVFALLHHAIPQPEKAVVKTTPKPVVTNPFQTPGPSATANSVQSDSQFLFEDAFMTNEEVIHTDDTYKSKNVFVTMERHAKDNMTYYVQDIYVRKVEFLQAGFAQDTYGRGVTEFPYEIAQRHNAVAAISGDHYGGRRNSVVIRNGELYRESAYTDVCVLYDDGTMRIIGKNAFDAQEQMDLGAYQAWDFGPSLLDGGGDPMTGFASSIATANPRTAIGYYEPGHYCFVVVDGREANGSDGMTFDELSLLMYELGCTVAYNLDGGQTSCMVFGGEMVNEQESGNCRKSSDAIMICDEK